jgi:5-(carboxyamino)imidazole ribonucleotide synthase
MSAYAAYRLGLSIAILEKERGSPAGQMTHREFVGSVNDTSLLRRFSGACDVITLENEFIDSGRIEVLERLGTKVVPSSRTIACIQDKLSQKQLLHRSGLPVPRFMIVNHRNDFSSIAGQLGLPFVVKSRKMGYDGYGNALVTDGRSFEAAFGRLTSRHAHLFAEEFVDFRLELAVMVARTRRETVAYPVVQTIQKDHICHIVIAPAPIGKRERAEAVEIAIEAVRAVRGYGMFGIELFLGKDGALLVNEMAPRPHNSGHYTIEGCVTSQFENHIRAVLNLPLGSPQMTAPCAVMVNALGKRPTRSSMRNLAGALRHRDAHLHIYGKTISRQGRKMGHVTLLGRTAGTLLRKARQIESQLHV